MREDRASVTAERNAWVRAVESNKPEGVRLFYDPYARYFLGPELRSIYEDPARTKELLGLWEQTVPGVPGSVLVRTAFIDRLLRACLDDEFQQVVILGAGYDTRAYRFSAEGPSAAFFELDHPATQAAKKERLGRIPGKHPELLVYVPMEFERESMAGRLETEGYRSDLKTFFILEGVSYYLTAEAVDEILAFVVNRSGPDSSIVFDYWPPAVADGSCELLESRNLRSTLSLAGESINFGIDPDRVENFLFLRGFSRAVNLSSREYGAIVTGHLSDPLNCSSIFYFVHARRGVVGI